ncbi:hypothetical protein [Amycolatopsis magusensis]|uniref:hypothetical protein n=1 Tax=Amycolatopsis magusensis TaxID=882444 RepID=UPI0037A835A2
MAGLRWGREMGDRIASPQARERGRRASAKLDAWAAEHRALSTLLMGVLCVVFAWMVARKHDGATTGEIVFWAVILVPIGIVSTWSYLTRIRRRKTAEPGDRTR